MKKIIAFLCFVVLLISCIKTAPLPDLAPSPLISVNSLLMNSADTNWVHLSIIYPYKDSSSISYRSLLPFIPSFRVGFEF